MAIKLRPSFTPKSFLAKVGEDRSTGKYRKDQIVFSQGDPADAVFYIQNGMVKITVISEQGKEAVVAILGANDFFGEGCLAGQARQIATAVTMTESVVVTAGNSRDSPRDPSGTSVRRDVHCRSSGTDNPRRSRPRRSAVQFERQQGLIRYNGHIEVHSSLLNVVLHDEPHIEA
jgi:Cyclic nucleotide-binding domain